MFGWLKKEPLVVGGHYRFYQYITNNPFDRSPYVTITAIDGQWIQYRHSTQHDSELDSYAEVEFRRAYKPTELRPDEVQHIADLEERVG